jgi:hypothetical protein
MKRVKGVEKPLTWAQCYKTFYIRNLRMVVISKSIRTCQAFPAWSYVYE